MIGKEIQDNCLDSLCLGMDTRQSLIVSLPNEVQKVIFLSLSTPGRHFEIITPNRVKATSRLPSGGATSYTPSAPAPPPLNQCNDDE